MGIVTTSDIYFYFVMLTLRHAQGYFYFVMLTLRHAQGYFYFVKIKSCIRRQDSYAAQRILANTEGSYLQHHYFGDPDLCFCFRAS
jgi:hypothetical protein